MGDLLCARLRREVGSGEWKAEVGGRVGGWGRGGGVWWGEVWWEKVGGGGGISGQGSALR